MSGGKGGRGNKSAVGTLNQKSMQKGGGTPKAPVAEKKPPPKVLQKTQITVQLPAIVTTQTVMTAASINAVATSGQPVSLSLTDGGPVVAQVQFAAAGAQAFFAACGPGPDHEAGKLTVNVVVTLPVREIAVANKGPFNYGEALTAEMIGATATGQGDAVSVTVLNPSPEGFAQVGVAPNVRITAAGLANAWQGATVDETIVITPKPRTVTARAPNKKIEFKVGQTLTTAAFGGRVSEGTDVSSFVTPPGGLLTAVGPVDVQLKVSAVGNYAEAVSPVVQITVAKGTPVITWPPVPAVVVNAPLDGTYLCATIDPPALAPNLVYVPALNGTLATAGTAFLKVSYAGDANWNAASAERRVLVAANQSEASGYQSMRDGTGSLRPANADSPNGRMYTKWDNDEDGIKTKAKELMGTYQDKTPWEIEADLLKQPGVERHGTEDEPLFTFPNGLQARLKYFGDKHNRNATFCLEGRTTAGPSATQNDIAFKITPEGVAAAKGPGVNDMDQRTDLDEDQWAAHKKGASSATHLECRKKDDPVIDWGRIAGGTIARGTDLAPVLASITVSGGCKFTIKVGKMLASTMSKDAKFFNDTTIHVDVEKNDRYRGISLNKAVRLT